MEVAMITRQLLPPPLLEDRDDPRVKAAVQMIRDKLGTKECFPDINDFLQAVERGIEKVKGAEAKKRRLQEAIEDLSIIRSSSKAIHDFLHNVDGIDEPSSFFYYLEAVDLSIAYLRRCLDEAGEREPIPEEGRAGKPSAPVNNVEAPPLKPIMNTKEVAAYLGKSPHTIRHYICDVKIPFHRTGEDSFPYFIRDEIDAWVKSGSSSTHHS
jgi:excisionase family DNA binding protein